MKKVFLGGTCHESTWREDLIPKLNADYFNPYVEDWTRDNMHDELRERGECGICLYVITRAESFYSIAEAVDDSNKSPGKTVFCHTLKDEHQKKHMDAVGAMVERNGGLWVREYAGLHNVLNNK